MTDTQQETEKREPLPADAIPPEKLYATLRRLAIAARTTVRHVERQHADVHKSLQSLDEATQAAEDLFYPPPKPDSPEGAETKFAHAVIAGEWVWMKGYGWLEVVGRLTGSSGVTSMVRWRLTGPGLIEFSRDFDGDDVVAVRRKVAGE